MIPIKIQCGCGQRYAFDVEPINGRVPSRVACPACGAEGTAAANEVIAQTLATAPPIVLSTAPPIRPTGLAQAAAPPGPKRSTPQPASRARDGWASDESQLNKVGTWITILPAVLAALLSWGVVGVEIPTITLCIIVAVCGLVGGALNIAGRGPVAAGACIGLLIALGGYGAVCWWIHDRKSVRKFELVIAFAVGAAPGFLVQYALQQILGRRSPSR